MHKKTILLVLIGILMLSAAGTYMIFSQKDSTTPSASLTVIGRASVKLTLNDGRIVYIDPYAGTAEDYSAPADLVLVTHPDEDHSNTDLVTLKPDAKVIQAPFDILPGIEVTEKNIKISAVDAYNSNHPKGQGVGYILEFDGIVFYHSGDTSYFEDMKLMKEKKIDYALLCMDGFYNMSPTEALQVADAIVPQHVIPIHTHQADAYSDENAAKFVSPLKLEVKPGTSIPLSK